MLKKRDFRVGKGQMNQGEQGMSKMILVVEDSPTDLQLVTNVLTSQGYAYVVATDGDEALRKAQQDKPALILLDVILPKKNGYQVCRAIKSSPDTRHIKVIVLSGKDQDTDRYWGLKQGADEYLTKPFSKDDLLTVVKHFSGRADT